MENLTQHNPTVYNGQNRIPYNYQEWFGSAVTNGSGIATFYFTHNGSSGGIPIISTPFKASAKFWVDSNQGFGFGDYTQITNGIQIRVTSLVVTGSSPVTNVAWQPASGVTVYLSIKGYK